MDQFDDQSPDQDQDFDETPAEQQDSAPELVRVRFNGKTYMVPEDVADAWHAREENFNKKFGEVSEELGYLRRQAGGRQQGSQEQPQESSFWEDPEGHIERRFAQERAQAQRQQAFQDAERAYWGSFYKAYPHLRSKQATVRGVMAQIIDSIKHLPPEESQARIAAAADRELGVEPDQGDRRRLSNKQVSSVSSSSGPRQRRQPEPEEDDEPYSGMDALAALRRKRQQARHK